MRHTLIPAKERTLIHREYHIRVAIVLISVTAISVVIGIAALFPAYIRAKAAEITAVVTLSNMRGHRDQSGLSQIEAELAVDKKLLAVLAVDEQTTRVSDLIRDIAGVRGSVVVHSFAIERQGTSTVQAVIRGVAPTRDGLLSFKSRLEGLAAGAKTDLPIEDLKKSVDAPFSMRLTISSI